ncbi:MAG: VOC family protein [Propionibacteriaceae bacterium]|jgi:catechol 2,3-dioxygenase-like lactoylglutathione lyase family enzyme|nr:VOC family protein [Propionibacteriaceae bacterium]
MDIGLVPELLVTSLGESLDFWCGLCGFEIVYERPEDKFACVGLGRSRVMLDQRGAGRDWETGPLERPYGRGVNFEVHVPAVQPLVERLRAARWPLFLAPEVRTYRVGAEAVTVEQFLVADPDGYLVRFQADIATSPSDMA